MLPTIPRAVLSSILLACCLPAVAREIHVSKAGSDDHSGTEKQPLASIEKAVEMMRGAGPGTIWIGPGEYELARGVRLHAGHGGTADAPLVIRGTEPRGARISGARKVAGFRPITAEEAEPLISEDAKQHVLVADLAEQGFPPLAAMPLQHRAHGLEEVVFDDRPMQSARWPNEGFAVFNEVTDPGASKPIHWAQREVYRPGAFRFPGDRAKLWDFERGVWLHGFWCYDWSDEVLKAASYDPDSGDLRLAAKHAYGVGSPWRTDSEHRFYALHVFEELDQPGEYYLDREKNLLFFWPPGDVAEKPVRLTLCREPLLAAEGVEHLVVRDLVFENGRGAGVRLANCRHARVENCLVRNMGGSGIDLSGTDVAAVRCEVTQTAAHGISIHGGDRKTLTNGECAVLECHIHHVGRMAWQSGRGIIVGGCGNRVANNLIHHAPTGAVSYSGNEHLMELNEIHSVCIHYSDVGVFYTGRDWCGRGNVVRWNYVHNIANLAGHGSSAVYFDDCDSGDTAVGNIVFGGVGRGVLLGGGRDNTIRGNIFIDLPVGIHVDARGPRGITLDKPGSWNLLAKCEAVDYLSPLWRRRYPRLARTMENEPLLPLGNAMHGNIFLGCKRPFALASDVKEEWLDRANNLVASLDDYPVIPAAEPSTSLDLSLLPAIWEQVEGFEPIPIDRIGLPKAD